MEKKNLASREKICDVDERLDDDTEHRIDDPIVIVSFA